MEKDKTLGDWVRRVRTGLKLTRRELADAIQVNPMTIYKWETGRRKPSARSIRAIELFLRVNREEAQVATDRFLAEAAEVRCELLGGDGGEDT